jgi:hypothetical protein
MSDNSDIIPGPVEELRIIFKEQLSSVAFPDINLNIIDALIGKVHAGVEELTAAEKRVEAAQEALNAANDELQQKCIKALAYAKIFAEGQEELYDKLSSISFSKPARSIKKTAPAERTKKDAATSAPRHKKESAAELESQAEPA